MLAACRTALVLFGALTLITGAAYPLAVTATAQLVAPSAANGSLVVDAHGRVVGSALVAQRFDGPGYFWPRPSAVDYDATRSGGTNLAPSDPRLADAVAARAADGANAIDRLTSSASGLDPHLSPEGAGEQVARVAAARGWPVAKVQALVDARVEPRTLGVVGEPRVNVLALNLALDGR